MMNKLTRGVIGFALATTIAASASAGGYYMYDDSGWHMVPASIGMQLQAAPDWQAYASGGYLPPNVDNGTILDNVFMAPNAVLGVFN